MSQQEIFMESFSRPTDRKSALPIFRLAGFMAEFRAWRERQKTARHLRQLSDRQLRDIGIDRYDLPPALQDDLIASRDRHGLLALYPHAVVAGLGAGKRHICD